MQQLTSEQVCKHLDISSAALAFLKQSHSSKCDSFQSDLPSSRPVRLFSSDRGRSIEVQEGYQRGSCRSSQGEECQFGYSDAKTIQKKKKEK